MNQTSSPRLSRYGDEYLSIGQEVAGKYIVLSIVGEGATSIVYSARRKESVEAALKRTPTSDLEDDTETEADLSDLVALKVIHKTLCQDPQISGRFQREASILERLQGPHIVRLFEALQAEDTLVLVIEHVNGTPLDRVIEQQKRLPVKDAVEIALQVCAGLGTAHAGDVVHRDLKPANVLYSRDDQTGRFFVKVADFGLAKVMQGSKSVTALTEHDMIFGTPEYMAPEQARGDEVDARSDIYALGCVLYELLTGEPPFRESSAMVTMTAHLTKEVISPRKRRNDDAISPALDAVVLRALSKDPAERYPSARALAEALLAAAAPTERVVATSQVADALSDTDLSMRLSDVLTSAELEASADKKPVAPTSASTQPLNKTAPGARSSPGVESDAKAATTALSQQDIEPPAPSDTLPLLLSPSGKSTGPLWLWIAIAVIAAAVGIGIGVAMGTG
ncbi:MAG: serine/threonine protein kinase [Polyangiaceae bacterium]|nr:serine/threonine protein kinase [Polyangiaceae bacterium]